ncbi:MAG: glycerol-3-phosphate acyltransferase [Acidimicrobiales bacterium]|nr:glycerol-3-phosphate acyltransferase [Actinomycetota bacterium]
MLRLLASAGLGYLAGALPTADTAARLAGGGATDLRLAGSGNPGAVNAMAVLGRRWGMAVLAADIAKGAAASVVGRRLAGDTGAHVGGTAAVIGHCFPVWSGFRGGKGVAPSCGQCLATFPVYFPIDLVVAWAVATWRQHALPATVVASSVWVAASTLWWRRGWPNAWGPRPTVALPAAATVTSAVILSRFAAAARAAGTPPAAPSAAR